MDVVCDCEYIPSLPFLIPFSPIHNYNYIYNYHHQYNRFYCISLLLRMLSPSLCMSILQSLCGFDEFPIFHTLWLQIAHYYSVHMFLFSVF